MPLVPRPFAARVLVAALALVAVPTATAWAQQDVIKQVEKLNAKALDAYDSLELDVARQALLSAVNKLLEAGLDDSPAAAQTYVNLGMVYIAGKDRGRGVQQFVKGLGIDPTVSLDGDRATPEMQEAFKEAQTKAAGGIVKPARPTRPATPPPPPPPDLPPPTPEQPMSHTPVDETSADQPVAIKVQIAPTVKAQRVFLFYRSGGQEEFTSVPMDSQGGGAFGGEIPSDALVGKTIQYYIEARNPRGQAVVASGSAASPYIISILGGKPLQRDDDENPIKPAPGDKPEPEPTPGPNRGFGRFYLSAMIGSGMGVIPAGSETEVAYVWQSASSQYTPVQINAGVASAALHVGAEAGVQINRNVSIGLLGRFQVYTAATADSSTLSGGTSKANGAVAGLLRFKYRFGSGRLHPYLHIDAGAGQIRHAAPMNAAVPAGAPPLVDRYTAENSAAVGATMPDPAGNEVCPNNQTCIDTVVMGIVLFGAGGGLWYDLTTFQNGGFGLVVDLNALVGVGPKFGVNFDLQIGFGVHFL